MANLNYYLIVAYFYLNIGDLVSTLIALPFGVNEVNPLYNVVGASVFFGIKIILPTIVVLSALVSNKHYENNKEVNKLIKYTFILLDSIWLIIIANNILVIFSQIGR